MVMIHGGDVAGTVVRRLGFGVCVCVCTMKKTIEQGGLVI